MRLEQVTHIPFCGNSAAAIVDGTIPILQTQTRSTTKSLDSDSQRNRSAHTLEPKGKSIKSHRIVITFVCSALLVGTILTSSLAKAATPDDDKQFLFMAAQSDMNE